MIDLLVINYNTQPELHRFITTIESDAPENPPWKLFIADNGSEDGSKEYVDSLSDKHFVTLQSNVGYARAANSLALWGEGDIIGVLNADIWLTTSDIMAIQNAFDEDLEVAILGPKQRDEKGFIVHAGIEGTNTAPRHRGWKEHDPHDLLYRDKKEVVTVSGSAYFVRRSVWRDLTWNKDYLQMLRDFASLNLIHKDSVVSPGPFLPTPHYYEETFCSYYARHMGYKVFYDGRISIGHSWHASHEVGSEHDQKFGYSQSLFRKACDQWGIERD